MDFLKSLLEEMDDEDDEIEERRDLRRVYVRPDLFNTFSDQQFKMRFRLDKANVMNILDSIHSHLEYSSGRNSPIAPLDQFLLTLRHYATGSFFMETADFLGVSKSSAHRIVYKVTDVLLLYRKQFIKLPQNAEELRGIYKGHFELAGFPKVLGLIDGTHIRIFPPGDETREDFRNRKGSYSLKVQCVANADLKIMDVVARWPGSAQDSTVFNSSRLHATLQRERFPGSVLLGDSAYDLTKFMMTPLTNPLTQEEILYNETHIATRNTFVRVLRAWKRRFPIIVGLGSPIKVINMQKIIVATIVLHNILRDLRDVDPPDDPTLDIDWDHLLDDDDDGNDDDDDDINIPLTASDQEIRQQGEDVRQKYISYFSRFC